MTAFDLARARAETPGSGTVLHFNNAGAAPNLIPIAVIFMARTAECRRQPTTVPGCSGASRHHTRSRGRVACGVRRVGGSCLSAAATSAKTPSQSPGRR